MTSEFFISPFPVKVLSFPPLLPTSMALIFYRSSTLLSIGIEYMFILVACQRFDFSFVPSVQLSDLLFLFRFLTIKVIEVTVLVPILFLFYKYRNFTSQDPLLFQVLRRSTCSTISSYFYFLTVSRLSYLTFRFHNPSSCYTYVSVVLTTILFVFCLFSTRSIVSGVADNSLCDIQ